MTESDAKEKWCPFSICGKRDSRASINRGNDWEGQLPVGSLCIASDCMAWRATDNEYLPQPPEYTGDNPSYPAGYCGLAGKP